MNVSSLGCGDSSMQVSAEHAAVRVITLRDHVMIEPIGGVCVGYAECSCD